MANFEALLSHLRRRTSGQDLIRPIDGLRFFAIATVVAYHANISACRAKFPGISDGQLAERMSDSLVTLVLNQGNIGVPIFFAISGFILGLPFARHSMQGSPQVPLGSYFERRLSRLELPYLISLGIAYAGHCLTGFWPSFSHVLASALYVHMFIFGTPSTINPISWSLEIEVQFYCVAPLLAGVFAVTHRQIRYLIYLALMTPSIIMRSIFDLDLQQIHLDQTLLGYGFYFVVGFLALELYMDGTLALHKKRHFALDLVGGLSVVTLLWPYEIPKLLAAIVFVPACLGLFLAAFRGVIFNAFFSSELIVVIGGMCYSIYLLHYGVMFALTRFIGQELVLPGGLWATTLVFLVVIVPASIGPCVAFFALVERPCMRRNWHRDLYASLRAKLGDRGV
jgi:peptidoglycan/LPS O-acetylase OafA/YrhL